MERKPTNLTILPGVTKEAKQCAKEEGMSLSELAESLLQEWVLLQKADSLEKSGKSNFEDGKSDLIKAKDRLLNAAKNLKRKKK